MMVPYTPQRAELFGALIGLARATFGNEDLMTPSTFAVVLEGLKVASVDADASTDHLSDLIRRVNEEKYKLVPSCFYCSSPCGRTSNYDMANLDSTAEDVRSLKLSLLAGLCDLAIRKTFSNDATAAFHNLVYRALACVGEDWSVAEFSAVLAEIEEFSTEVSTTEDAVRKAL